MIDHFGHSLDTLDAEVFSGDALESSDNRKALAYHLKRWIRALHTRDLLPFETPIADGFIVVEGEGNDETFGFASSIDELVNEHINDRIVECQDNEIIPPLLHIVPFVLVR